MKLLVVHNAHPRTFISGPYVFDLGMAASLNIKEVDEATNSMNRAVYYFFKDSVTAEAVEVFLDSVPDFKTTFAYEVREATQADLDLLAKTRKFSAEYPIEGFFKSRSRNLPTFGDCEIKMVYTDTTVTIDVESSVDNAQLQGIIDTWLAV